MASGPGCTYDSGRMPANSPVAIDVVHEVAVLALAFTFIRGLQAMAEHYFPNSDPAAVARYLFGGP